MLLAVVAVSQAVQVPVSMIDNAFQPDTVMINPGDSVIWTNNGEFTHTSTSGVNGVWDSLWDSGNMAHGVTFVHGFPTDGTFNYYCTFHWMGGMRGVVVVGASGSSEEPGSVGRAVGISSSPNPFSTSTTIRVAHLDPADDVLRVFDASGRLVRTLGTGVTTAAVWDGRDSGGRPVRPGAYFCVCGARALVLTRLPAAGR
jgi:plastocyanin